MGPHSTLGCIGCDEHFDDNPGSDMCLSCERDQACRMCLQFDNLRGPMDLDAADAASMALSGVALATLASVAVALCLWAGRAL